MVNKRSLNNLKPFKKGHDPRRNLNGAPPMPDIREAMIELLSEPEEGKTKLRNVLDALYKRAVKGDIRAVQEVLDRMYGKSRQSVDVTSGGEKIQLSPQERDAEIARLKRKLLGDEG